MFTLEWKYNANLENVSVFMQEKGLDNGYPLNALIESIQTTRILAET